MVADATAFVAAVKARHPDLPLYLLGDSMGGAVSMVALARDPAPPVKGAILVAPAVWGRNYLGPIKRSTLWLTAHTIPWFPLTAEGLDIEPSDNKEMLRELARDDLVLKQTRVDTVWGVVNLMDAANAAADRIDAPLLLLYGAKDDIIPKAPTRAVLRRLMARGKSRAAYYKNGYHMLLRDLKGDEVARDVVAWMKNPRARLPSGADRAAGAWLDTSD
jgi:alpha-beta hydrolase superfamily lysophospholipase